MAAVLDASPGAVLSHEAAARRWGAPGFDRAPLHVTRHRGIARRASSLARVHEVVDLMPAHVKLIRSVPVTSPARTVFDLAGSLHPVERSGCWTGCGTSASSTAARLTERWQSWRLAGAGAAPSCESWPLIVGLITCLPPADSSGGSYRS